jgi:hypothetical protein
MLKDGKVDFEIRSALDKGGGGLLFRFMGGAYRFIY